MRWLCAALAALALLAALRREARADAGKRRRRREPFTVILDYFPNADHAGIYAAQAAGPVRQGRAGREDRRRRPTRPRR